MTYTVHAEAVGQDYDKHQKNLLAAYYACPVQAIELEGDDPSVQISWYEALIVEKKELSDSVMEIQLKSAPNDFKPGQYITVRFKDDIGYFSRAYSIVDMRDGIITLCVALVHGGRGSSFFSNYEVGNTVEVTEPKGEFCLLETDRPKVFVGTGTGLAPLLAMMESCPNVKKTLYFGQRKENELFYLDRLARIPNLDVKICLSRADENWTGLRGRITEHFPGYPLTRDTEVYTCGSDPMMKDLQAFLKKRRHPSKLFLKESFSSASGPEISSTAIWWSTWVRRVHIYASLLMSVLFLFFGLSGFLASRPSLFNSETCFEVPANIQLEQNELSGYLKSKLPGGALLKGFSVQEEISKMSFEDGANGRFDVEVCLPERSYTVTESHPLPADADSKTALQLARMLAKKYPGKLDEGSIEEDSEQIMLNIESVWADTAVMVDKAQKRYEVHQSKNPVAAALVQLHRGKKSGPVQRVLIDLTGLFMAIATLTGMIMAIQSRNPVMRNTALILVGISIALTAVMIMNR
jgi:NAD(P)H-flavin reductase